MNAKLAHVANRIRSELTELEEVVRRVEEGWKRAEGSLGMITTWTALH